MLSMIVAIDRNNGIGKNGDQLVYISDDLKHFKAVTTGKTVIMGRKTSNALPKGVLPNRRNIIVTRSLDWTHEGAEIAHSIPEALMLISPDDEAFVMGGGEIYSAFMPYAEKLVVTEIDKAFEGVDTFFPQIKSQEWIVDSTSPWMHDDKNDVNFRYVVYLAR